MILYRGFESLNSFVVYFNPIESKYLVFKSVWSRPIDKTKSIVTDYDESPSVDHSPDETSQTVKVSVQVVGPSTPNFYTEC